jgi:3-hydroxyisobutyrate dehydrogenase
MSPDNLHTHKLGWIGTGRMGFALAARLLDAGCDLALFNRTRSKAEPLAEKGGKLVDSPGDLADRDIVFTIVAGDEDFREVTIGDNGVLAQPGAAPQILVDSTTVSAVVSGEVRAAARKVGTDLLAAPVSGNPRVVSSGKLTLAVSGPKQAFETMRPYLDVLGKASTYVGDDDVARLVKLCHNLMLGVVVQTLAEITLLAEKGGVKRSAFLEFLNQSVMGSIFTRYKTPAFVNLDYTTTFTPVLLRKDFDLGLDAARRNGIPMPVATLVGELVQSVIGNGATEEDFAILLDYQARAAGMNLVPENIEVSDGLEEGDPS